LNSLSIGKKVSEGFVPFSELIDSTPPLTQWMYGLTDMLFGNSLTGRHIIAFFILFLQACYLGIVFINKKAFTENTYLPSVFFVIFAAISFDVVSVSGTLLASGFLLLAIHSFFKEIEFREPNDESLVKLGVYLSLASLSVFSYIIFFFGAQLILLLFTRSSLRRQLLFLTGFLLPHGLLLVWYYLFDNQAALFDFFYLANLLAEEELLISTKTLLVLGSVPLFYFVISIFILNRAVRLTNYQSQLLQAMFIWLFAGIVHLFFTRTLRPQSLLPLFPPLSFLLTHFILAIRRKRFAELNLWVMIMGVSIIASLTRGGFFENVNYNALLAKQEPKKYMSSSLLILDNNTTQYQYTPLANGFCEWRLCGPIFSKPNTYANVVLVHHQFELHKPSVIVDPHNLIQGFFPYLPALKEAYVKQGDNYFLKSQ
jgi:4-amino-4-deoxy-L-arabinose transferase-like glycosyltransferase